MMRRVLPLLTGLVLGLTGCSEPQQAAGFEMPPTPVEAAEAEAQPVRDTFEAVGTIEASESITVVTEIEGTVLRLPFTEGARVRKGDLLIQLDDAQLSAEVARAEALRDQSQQNYDRVQNIVAQKVGPPQDLDDAAAALKVAEANLRVAQTRLAKTKVYARSPGWWGPARSAPERSSAPGIRWLIWPRSIP